MRNVFIMCAGLELSIPTNCKYDVALSIKRIYKMTVNKLGFEIVFFVDMQNCKIYVLVLNTNETLLFTYTV